MNKNVLLAAAVGGITAFLLGWLIFGVLLMDYMNSHMVSYPGLMKSESEMDLGLLFVSNLVLAALLAWSFDRMGVKGLMAGVRTGAVMGLLFYLSVDLSFLAMMNLFSEPMAAVVDVLSNALWVTGVGAAVGMVLGRTARA